MKDWKKHKGFKVPDGYFDGLNDKIHNRVTEKEDRIPDHDGFGVPDAYFDNLHEKIKNRLEPQEPKVVQLRTYRRYWVTAASIAALIAVAVMIPWQSTESPSFDTLASAEIEAYLEAGNLELNSYELAEFLPEEAILENELLGESVEDENIIEYLDDTIEDIDEFNLDYDEE